MSSCSLTVWLVLLRCLNGTIDPSPFVWIRVHSWFLGMVPDRDALLRFARFEVCSNFSAIKLEPLIQATTLKPRQVYLVANGDLRLSANQKCWPAQARMEAALGRALRAEGWTVVRAHPHTA